MNEYRIIFNGGEPLDGCFKDWETAYKWSDDANENKNEYFEPIWSLDCGFKLDYDGPILSISSRFYPPKTHYGPKWDGQVVIYLLGNEVIRKEFKTTTVDELKIEVELFVKTFAKNIKQHLKRKPGEAEHGNE